MEEGIVTRMTSHHSNNNFNLSRLLQIVSPMLPVGAYSYSQGLEWAIESEQVHDAETAKTWMHDVLLIYQANFELPVLHRLYQAWDKTDFTAVQQWDAYYQAGRDTSEALAETRQMGYSLRRLINDLEMPDSEFIANVNSLEQPAFSTLYAGLAQHWQIPLQATLEAYAWAWLENQASAAMKAVPLGQVAGQKILFDLGQELPSLVAKSMALADDEISNFNPLLTIAGCQHETQYSRLFRS